MAESSAPVISWENVVRELLGRVKYLVDEPTWVWLSAALNHRIGGCPDCSGRQARARHELG